LLLILFVFNVMACYARPDFLTQLAIVLSLFFLQEGFDIDRNTFRFLPILILVSIFYDFIYMVFVQNLS
jgi:hypothetical protein